MTKQVRHSQASKSTCI